jgi:hypothetical protein
MPTYLLRDPMGRSPLPDKTTLRNVPANRLHIVEWRRAEIDAQLRLAVGCRACRLWASALYRITPIEHGVRRMLKLSDSGAITFRLLMKPIAEC